MSIQARSRRPSRPPTATPGWSGRRRRLAQLSGKRYGSDAQIRRSIRRTVTRTAPDRTAHRVPSPNRRGRLGDTGRWVHDGRSGSPAGTRPAVPAATASYRMAGITAEVQGDVITVHQVGAELVRLGGPGSPLRHAATTPGLSLDLAASTRRRSLPSTAAASSWGSLATVPPIHIRALRRRQGSCKGGKCSRHWSPLVPRMRGAIGPDPA